MLERDGVKLACREFGGRGQTVLLLHGLAGYSGEWNETASWLCERSRVVAVDQRGHGRSERAPTDVSREAHVADVVFVTEQLGLAPVVLVGQSLGGHLAILVAARHPELVCGLVVVEASPAGGDEDAVREGVGQLGESLRRWPVPFESRQAAVEYFGGPSPNAEAWADGLEQRDDGLWPAFEVQAMERTLREAVSQPYWEEWRRIRCPVLIVRAGSGTLDRGDAEAMAETLPQARLVEIPDATHDLHLDQPSEWRGALRKFLDELDAEAT